MTLGHRVAKRTRIMGRTYPELLEAAHLGILILHLDVLVSRDVGRRRPVRVDIALPRHVARLGWSPRLLVYWMYYGWRKGRTDDV